MATAPSAPTHFLSLADVAADELRRLVLLAGEIKADADGWGEALRGRTVLLQFDKPSARTRISFETAAARLGAQGIYIGDAGPLGVREPIRDLARVVSRMCAAAVIRTYGQADVEEFARWSSVPVINGLTDLHHPCQALADVLTMTERFGGLTGLDVAFVGDGGSNVCHSLLQACALSGAWLRIGCPPEHAPRPGVLAPAQALAEDHGGQILVTADPREAVRDVSVVSTDVFVSMGEEASRGEKLAALAPYRVDAALMAEAGPDAVFMHCLPAHRGEEVTDEVLDGPQSIVWDQAENRLHTAAALLVALTGGERAL